MKLIAVALLALAACATVAPSGNSPEYDNPGPCPSEMTEQQQRSGYYQCRAECASWGRNIVEFDSHCRCICTQPVHPGSPTPDLKKATPGKTPNTQI